MQIAIEASVANVVPRKTLRRTLSHSLVMDASPSGGLSSAEAARLLELHGRNELVEKLKPWWRLYAEQFVEPMPCVIWAAIAIELALAIKYHHAWPDFGVLVGLQFVNGTVSFYEAFKAGSAIEALKAGLKPFALAKRDGAWGNLEATLLVPGDLIKLDSGAHVPADCRVVDGTIQVCMCRKVNAHPSHLTEACRAWLSCSSHTGGSERTDGRVTARDDDPRERAQDGKHGHSWRERGIGHRDRYQQLLRQDRCVDRGRE